ncbi:MAG: alpha/beta hydrolase [Myxococcales bacterium]|nr:alpha/beta hydrolase [Myxococcales bacterium]MCB9733975.1 alpha/beta hydrolase [Deltaproteobacteria bacterium]
MSEGAPSDGFVPAHLDVTAPGAEPARSVVVLHGIMGSASNWRGFCRALAASLPDVRFVLVDLRHHGDSAGAPPPDTVAACAEDVARLAGALDIAPEAIVGHSFGGKVALLAAKHLPSVRRVVLVDAPVGPIPEGTEPHEVERVLEALHAVPMPLPARADLEPVLRARGIAPPIVQWMGTNLRPEAGAYVWRFDLAGIERLLADYAGVDLWPLLEDRGGRDFEVTLVRGGRSDRFEPGDVAHLEDLARAGFIDHRVLPEAGHWVHAEDPKGLSAVLERLLRARRA